MRSDISLHPVANALTLIIHDQLSEVVVGELVLSSRDHLVVQVGAECGSARHHPQVLHVILVTVVDQ